MAHRYATLENIADFSKGTNQAPGFMRKSKGAAAEMTDLVIDLNGRPVTRKGYVNANISGLTVGTEDGNNASGDNLHVAHYLGSTDDDTTGNPVKRLYYFDNVESWASDPTGRIIYVAREARDNYLIDVRANKRYTWDLSPPPHTLVTVEQFVHRNSGIGVEFSRNESEMESQVREIVNRFRIINNKTSAHANNGIYVVLALETDVQSIEVYIDRDDAPFARDDRRATLYRGPLEQGSYVFYWDLHDLDAEPVNTTDGYVARVKIEDNGLQRVLSATPGGSINDSELELDFRIETKSPSNVPVERFSVGLRQKAVCWTFSNPDLLDMESRPTGLFPVPLYEAIDNTRDVDFQPTITVSFPQGLILKDWVSNLNLYVSDDVPGPDFDYDQSAGDTGLLFKRHASTERTEEDRFTHESIDIDPTERVLDSFDHDEPPPHMHVVAPHGVGLWGAERNTVYFSKIGNQGEQRLYAMPSENALVPHKFDLVGSSQSPVIWIHPAAHVTGLLAFKRDAIHVIRGKGVIEGLYNPETPIQVDLDASNVIEGTGTSSPKSVLTVGNGVYFVGSDKRYYRYGLNWRGQADLKDVGLPVQRYLDELREEDLPGLTAFLYQNCYHLIMPDRVLIMDMTRNYWTGASWRLKDAFWSRGGINSESILYGVTRDNNLVELYKGNTDGGDPIGGIWESNPVPIPSESVLTGVLAVHTSPTPIELTCAVMLDDVEDPSPRTFTPAKYNDFRCGTHKSGSRVSVKLSSDDGFPLLDRVQAELFLAR